MYKCTGIFGSIFEEDNCDKFIAWKQNFWYVSLHIPKTRGFVGWACVAHLSFCFEETWYRTFQGCFLPSSDSFGQAVSEETIFLEIHQSKTRIACGGHVF
jgi:hypothetical protein